MLQWSNSRRKKKSRLFRPITDPSYHLDLVKTPCRVRPTSFEFAFGIGSVTTPHDEGPKNVSISSSVLSVLSVYPSYMVWSPKPSPTWSVNIFDFWIRHRVCDPFLKQYDHCEPKTLSFGAPLDATVETNLVEFATTQGYTLAKVRRPRGQPFPSI